MKNKPINYVLGLGVAAIWVIVLFRIYVAFFGKDDNQTLVADLGNASATNAGISQDSLTLALDYEDPFAFALSVPKATSENIDNGATQMQVVPATPPIAAPIATQLVPTNPAMMIPKPIPNSRKNGFKWEAIKYKGLVESGQKVGLVKYNGMSKFVKEKDRLDSNLYVVELNPDYIKMKHADSLKTILIGN